jgi:hypothetical protein
MSEQERLTPEGLRRWARARGALDLEPEALESLLRRVEQLEREVRSLEPLVGQETEPLASPPVEGD